MARRTGWELITINRRVDPDPEKALKEALEEGYELYESSPNWYELRRDASKPRKRAAAPKRIGPQPTKSK